MITKIGIVCFKFSSTIFIIPLKLNRWWYGTHPFPWKDILSGDIVVNPCLKSKFDEGFYALRKVGVLIKVEIFMNQSSFHVGYISQSFPMIASLSLSLSLIISRLSFHIQKYNSISFSWFRLCEFHTFFMILKVFSIQCSLICFLLYWWIFFIIWSWSFIFKDYRRYTFHIITWLVARTIFKRSFFIPFIYLSLFSYLLFQYVAIQLIIFS